MVRWTLGFLSGIALLGLVACSKSGSSSGTPAANDPSSSGGTSGTSGKVSGGTSSSGAVADGPPRVDYIGRIDATDKDAPRIGWAGTKVIVRFEGTALSIEIDEEETTDGGSHYDVNVDGKSTSTLALADGDKTYQVVKDLPAGTHVVTLTRRTEPQVGVSQLKAFTFPNGGKLLAPPAETSRHIEFVGDSEIAGYGIECASKDDSFTAATENELLTYPELVAAQLHAESHNLAYSGKGVSRNELGGGDKYGAYYPQAVPRAEATAWDFSWKPDVVWVALGANDYDPGPNGDRPAPTSQSFTAAYRALLDVIRAKNPEAKIVLVVQAFVNDDYPAGYNARTSIRNALQTLVNEHKAKGDANVLLAELPQATDGDLTGCDSHPNPALHAKLAPIVAAKIAEITGWK